MGEINCGLVGRAREGDRVGSDYYGMLRAVRRCLWEGGGEFYYYGMPRWGKGDYCGMCE